MKTFREACREQGVERYNSVKATVSGFNKKGTYAVIDGTDCEAFYFGGTQKIGNKVLIFIDGINENKQKIYATFEHEYDAA